jgi:hypothetical protein
VGGWRGRVGGRGRKFSLASETSRACVFRPACAGLPRGEKGPRPRWGVWRRVREDGGKKEIKEEPEKKDEEKEGPRGRFFVR